ncbi:DNA polymerase III subunit chi [Pseudogemmobacter humi]|uniref:DNA polymerase III subunit chi n=1 Tax=Pseudogemmobacter humi TaxID=2483812 RepID=A0A3P5X5K0_9RHOB|nr:DNA polymerase III subunit chi [Pseudogemmobacter humi]VDC30135.1 DNA polymerase III subunit chi [Pseudogemmobacter humi]
MGAVKFYHLTRHALDEAAQMLLGQALAQGWRVMLRGPSREGLERLDSQLWLRPEEGFLPHGLEGGPHDADQPVLLGEGAAVNGARAVMLLAGVRVEPEEARGMERVWLLFEDADEAQVKAARAEWKAVTAAGLAAEYWADASGRWEKKAESGAGG